jgi:energy-converting hydrogenase Eha subunit C
LGLTTRLLLLSESCGYVDVGAVSLTRERVCRLKLLLLLASAVIHGSEFRGIRNHILFCHTVVLNAKVTLRPTVQSASLCWNKATIWGLRPDLYYCRTDAGFLMWGALSDERTSLSFATVTAVISLLSVGTICILHVIECMYMQDIQGLCQSRLSRADHALLLVAPGKTAL